MSIPMYNHPQAFSGHRELSFGQHDLCRKWKVVWDFLNNPMVDFMGAGSLVDNEDVAQCYHGRSLAALTMKAGKEKTVPLRASRGRSCLDLRLCY